jgi:hypothetical protein
MIIGRRGFVKLGAAAVVAASRSVRALGNNADIFTDRAREAGLDFVHFNGMSGEHYYPEVVGSGVALFDYDNDGDLDILFVQGCMLSPDKTLSQATFPPQSPLRAQLYRNDSIRHADGSCTLKFTNVTEESGIDAHGYGMGVAAADFNNDGHVDLYITNLGHNQLWRNNGDGTFTDVTQQSGTGVSGWSTSAAFVDYDRDGWLDLFVCNYLDFSSSNPRRCLSPAGAVEYCGPQAFDPLPNRLFRNRRDGTFEDVTARSGIGSEYYGAMGVVCADFNHDGWMDIFVANDGRPNLLWVNQQDGTFKNDAMLAGCALDINGAPQSGMGVDAGDLSGRGLEDLAVTNLTGEYTDIYLNNGSGWFEDRSYQTGVAQFTRPYTGFGLGMFDYDNDGRLDLMIANGAVKTIQSQVLRGDRYPLRQRNQLLRSLGSGAFEDVSDRAGPVFSQPDVSRGIAIGDLNNDGALDAVIVTSSGPARLLINNVGTLKPWIGLRMVDEKGKRDVIGTRVAVFRKNAPVLWRRVHSDGSFCSSSDPRLVVGLGDFPEITKIRACWVSGRVEEWSPPPLRQYTTFREGSGKLVQS